MSNDDGERVCRGCGLPPDLCACGMLPRLEVDFEIVVVQHVAECNKGSNTVRLLETILPRTRVHVFGGSDVPFDARSIANLARPIVLFPRGDTVLTREHLTPGSTLVLLDGTWSQGRRMARRVPGLEGLPFARLPEGEMSTWSLRSPPEAHMLCTLEATSRAVRIAGQPRTADRMIESLKVVELHSLHSRGFLNRHEFAAALAELSKGARD